MKTNLKNRFDEERENFTFVNLKEIKPIRILNR